MTLAVTDNGREFTDRLFGLRKRAATGNHEFDRLCAELGIEHRLAPPMHPQTNGMVERFNGRIEDVLQSHRFRSGEDLEHTILRYVLLYNGQLPQSVLKGRTPLAALKDWHRDKPELFRKRPYNHPGWDTCQWASVPGSRRGRRLQPGMPGPGRRHIAVRPEGRSRTGCVDWAPRSASDGGLGQWHRALIDRHGSRCVRRCSATHLAALGQLRTFARRGMGVMAFPVVPHRLV